MRAATAASVIAHAAILGLGFLAFPEARPFTAEKLDALPVELVDTAEVTDLLKGSKTSELLPEEAPQPGAVAKAETPAPDPVEEPAEKPVEAAQPPQPPAPEPEAEPEQTAALPEPAPEPPQVEPPEPPAPESIEEAIAPPEPPKPVEPRKPKQRPTPPATIAAPKKVIEVKPQPKISEPRPEEEKKLRQLASVEAPKDFDAEDISALLNKQEPAGGGDPEPGTKPQTLGTADGSLDAKMTQSEIAALQARLYQCWNPPIAVREAVGLTVSVRIDLSPDGSLAAQPQLISVAAVSDPRSQAAADSAIRAVNQCAPFGDILRPETYAEWRQIDFVFDPRGMLGG